MTADNDYLQHMLRAIEKYLPQDYRNLPVRTHIGPILTDVELYGEEFKIIFSYDWRELYLGCFIRSDKITDKRDVGNLRHIASVLELCGVDINDFIPRDWWKDIKDPYEMIDRATEIYCMELRYLYLWIDSIK